MAKSKKPTTPPITDPSDPNYIPSDDDLFNAGKRMLGRLAKHYDTHTTELPPAAVVAQFLSFGKAMGVVERAVEQTRREEQATASFDYVPRVGVLEERTWRDPVLDNQASKQGDGFEGIDPEDHQNISKRARFLARDLPDGPEKDRLLERAREAEAKQ